MRFSEPFQHSVAMLVQIYDGQQLYIEIVTTTFGSQITVFIYDGSRYGVSDILPIITKL